MLSDKKLQVFMGHYGSGKTSIAVNTAIAYKRGGNRVILADLDIVNPYFRTVDSRRELESEGVELIASRFAGSNLDIPALPAELYGAITDNSAYTLLDIGGDDRGAVALGRYVPDILKNGYMAAFVVNFYRPLTTSPVEAMEVLREVEAASGIKCTCLINNSNLGGQTSAQDIIYTLPKMEKLGSACGLPVYMTAVDERLYDALKNSVPNILQLKLTGIAAELNS